MLYAHCMQDARLILCCCAGCDSVPQQLPVLQHLGPLQRMADVGLVFQFPERHFLGATVGQVSPAAQQASSPHVLDDAGRSRHGRTGQAECAALMPLESSSCLAVVRLCCPSGSRPQHPHAGSLCRLGFGCWQEVLFGCLQCTQ